MDLEHCDIKILIVDDEPEILEALKTHLELSGYQVDVAKNSKTGLELFQKSNHHIVLVDIKMPEMDGFDILERITTINSATLSIMITGYSSLQRVLTARNHGAYSYLLKPFRDLNQVDIALEGAVDHLNRWNRIILETHQVKSEGDHGFEGDE